MKSSLRSLMACTAVVAFFGLALAARADAPLGGGDWPQYRHDVHSTWDNPGIFTAAEAANLTPLWTFELGAPDYAQPTLVGDLVYVVSAWKSGKLFALDAKTGSVRWQRHFPGGLYTRPGCGDFDPGIWDAPAVVDGILYVGAPDGSVYALDAATGTTQWSVAVALPLVHGEFLASSPAVSKALGKLYIGISAIADCDLPPGKIVSIDLATHQALIHPVLAPGRVGAGIWSSITVDEQAGVVYATTGNPIGDPKQDPLAQAVVAFDAFTLQALDHWQDPNFNSFADSDFGASPTLFTAADGTPLVAAPNKDGNLYAWKRGALSAGPVWQRNIAVEGGPDEGRGSIVAPTFANGVLYAAGEQTAAGEPGTVLALEPGTGALLWKHVTPGYVLPGMATVGDVLIVPVTTKGNGSHTLEVLDVHTGAVLKSFSGSSELWAAPMLGRGLLVFPTASGHVTALAVPDYLNGGGSTDGGVPDAGSPDGGVPDAGSPDAGSGGGGTGTLFADDFNRTSGLGSAWQIASGLWKTSTRAESDLDGADQAMVQGLSCADCSVQARVINFGAGSAELDLRETQAGDRYEVALLSSGQLQIRRRIGGGTVVLADGPSGIGDLGNWATLSLSAQGTLPVQLTASVNGAVKLTAVDASPMALSSAGTAGMWTELAGIWFGQFVVTGTTNGGGSGDAGTPDAGPPDAGPPDAGPPDAGPPDAGPPDAGPPDGGTSGGGGTLFFDNFNRTLSSGLGANWQIDSGAWRDNDKANSDLDAPDQASVIGLSCADCSVQAKVVNFGASIAALDLRHTGSGDRYDLALLSSGRLQIRRHNGGGVTVIGDVPSGIVDLTNWSTLALSATGGGPVQLVGSVNGVARLTVVDTSPLAIATAGTSGISTAISGVLFDDFTVTGSGSSGGSDGGVTDGGTTDGGVTDGGTTDGGVTDGGTTDGGMPGAVLFADDFNRTLCCSLGPNWTIVEGEWRDNNKANSDRDGLDRAAVAGVSCADCRADADMVNFGGGEAMLELRGSGADRYALALRADGVVEIRRYLGGVATVLASAPSGVADITNWASFSFTVQGTSPVVLTGFANGVAKVTAQDSSSSALTGAGTAGLAAIHSGILFDNYKLTGM